MKGCAPAGGSRRLSYRSVLALAALAACLQPPTSLAQRAPSAPPPPAAGLQTTEDYNRRLEQLHRLLAQQGAAAPSAEYRIGPEDLLEITVFDAKELDRTLRVSSRGEISLPLLGAVHAAGLTPQELESALAERLRQQFMKEPQVTVFVKAMESHAVSVFGAVRKAGVYQLRGVKSLVEVLSLAEGLSEDAGEVALVERGAGLHGVSPPETPAAARTGSDSATPEPAPNSSGTVLAPPGRGATLEINLKRLLESGDPTLNVPVYPNDMVKVPRAGVIYVVGEVKKPGGFLLKSSETISVLQALALAEGLTRTAQKSQARIIRTEPGTGQRSEVAVDLGRILAGKAADPVLQPRDIVFIPNSAARSGLYRAGEAAVSVVTGLLVFRR